MSGRIWGCFSHKLCFSFPCCHIFDAVGIGFDCCYCTYFMVVFGSFVGYCSLVGCSFVVDSCFFEVLGLEESMGFRVWRMNLEEVVGRRGLGA